MASRFARPDTITLTLANGETLVVKRRLNSEDARYMKAMQEFATLAEPAVVIVYLIDWSITDDGKPVPVAGLSRTDLGTVLNNLDEDAFDEIYAAIKAHRDAMIAEREAEKKSQGGTPSAPKTSGSPSAAAGPSSTSEASTKTTTPAC